MDTDWKFLCDCGHAWTGPFPETDEDQVPCPKCKGCGYEMKPACWKTNALICADLMPVAA